MKKAIVFLGIIALTTGAFTACKKDAGKGGTSAISGKVTGRDYYGGSSSAAQQEVTQLTFPVGNKINDGEYILLNTPNGGTLYYIWFKWDNGVQPNPNLTGRVAIQVNYSYTDNNATIASSVAAAIQAVANTDFSVVTNNDIVTITNRLAGIVPDGDELTKEILFDVLNQGKDGSSTAANFIDGPMMEERVYLVYGDDSFYSDNVRTDANGNYEFTGLNRGKYTIYVFSKDENNLNGALHAVETEVEITAKKSVVEATELYMFK